MNKLNAAGRALLLEYEAFAKTTPDNPNLAHAYWDAIGKVWTLGEGFTEGVREGDVMTRAENDHLVNAKMNALALEIEQVCTITPNENELAAFLCMAWNTGMGWKGDVKPKGAKDGFRQSSVLKAHNRGDKQAASRAFGLWNKSGGKEVNGLTRRRAAEAALYLKPVSAAVAPMPQAVDGETTLTKSPIIRASTLTVGASTLAVVSESVKSVKAILGDIAPILPWVLVAVVVLAAGYAIYHRTRQRKLGWA